MGNCGKGLVDRLARKHKIDVEVKILTLNPYRNKEAGRILIKYNG